MIKKAILISINSDIGYFFAEQLLKENFKIVGTYRTYNKRLSNLKKKGVILKKIDFSKKLSNKIIQNLIKSCQNWDLLLNFAGDQNPIGKILTLKNIEIIKSFNINFLAQFIITKEILKFKKRNSFVLFFAGGGVNSATMNYSTYTLSKIALIKLVELLDFEVKNTKFSIIGPGWVNTKIHNSTLISNKAGKNITSLGNDKNYLRQFDSNSNIKNKKSERGVITPYAIAPRQQLIIRNEYCYLMPGLYFTKSNNIY